MILFAPAKINVGLNIKERRSDGYHEIESVMVALPIYDILEILPADSFSFSQSGLNVESNVEDNLIVRAYRLMKKNYSFPEVYIHLIKQIPMGAGLGGGSSDAAYTLIGINELYDLKISSENLKQLAAELGSDCSFFIEGLSQFAEGRGEILKRIDLSMSGYFVRVINPGIHVNTRQAYSNIHFKVRGESIAQIVKNPISTWRDTLLNDFEATVFKEHPELKELKEMLYRDGAIYASMTGSGSSIYGIYKDEPKNILTNKFERVVRI